jgi:hypothetical protein
MGRPRIAEETAVVSIRLPIDLVNRLDRYADELRAVTPGVNVTRTDAARAVLTLALDHSKPPRLTRETQIIIERLAAEMKVTEDQVVQAMAAWLTWYFKLTPETVTRGSLVLELRDMLSKKVRPSKEVKS